MSSPSHKREAIILGALLHDIGKFVQRAQPNPKDMDHCRWGDQWFEKYLSEKLSSIFEFNEKDIIRSSINTHHAHMEYISLADAISAGMERIELYEEEHGDPFSESMKLIFSGISLSGNSHRDMYHQLSPLGKEALNEIFPVEDRKVGVDSYKQLLSEFNDSIGQWDTRGKSPINAIDDMQYLLWKYTWSIPSATYKSEPDISLFDHLKTTAAITACLYDFAQEIPDNKLYIDSQAFQFVAGDISGIQNYIFDVLSQQGKVAKRLRARSFFIQMISEVATHILVHQFNLPLCNIISSAGGNFLVLLPNRRDFSVLIEKIRSELDRYLYENYQGELYLSLADVPANGISLKGFGEILKKAKASLGNQKKRPLAIVLITQGKWNEGAFLLDEIVDGDEKACQGCHKHPVFNTEQQLCHACLADVEMGKDLTRAKYIAFFADSHSEFPIFNYSFELWPSYRGKSDAYLIVALNECLSLKGHAPFKFLANHIPSATDVNCHEALHEHENNPMASFECIANHSEGDSLLGYVKGDIDNMGLILDKGFGETFSISRYCSFSRMIETFFAGYLQKKLETDFNDIYTVYSGGDDFFIVGPWNRIIDFSAVIRKEFDRFTGHNPDLCFSAGIHLSKSFDPISFCAEKATEGMNSAKGVEGKNSITLFGQSMSWQNLDLAMNEANLIKEWIEKDPPLLTKSLVYNFRKYGEMAQKANLFGGPIRTRYLKFIPQLTNDISRNLSRDDQLEAALWAKKLIPSKGKPLGGDFLPFLKIIMEYVLNITRSR